MRLVPWRTSWASTRSASFSWATLSTNLHYDKSPWKHPEYFEEKYRILAPYLNVISTDPHKERLAEQLADANKQKDALLRMYQIKNETLENRVSKIEKAWAVTQEKLQRIKERYHSGKTAKN